MTSHELTKRERQIFKLIIQGFSYPQIADALQIATNTVRNHVRTIFYKTGVRSRYELLDPHILEEQG